MKKIEEDLNGLYFACLQVSYCLYQGVTYSARKSRPFGMLKWFCQFKAFLLKLVGHKGLVKKYRGVGGGGWSAAFANVVDKIYMTHPTHGTKMTDPPPSIKTWFFGFLLIFQ